MIDNQDVRLRTLTAMKDVVLDNILPHLKESSAVTSAHVLVRFIDYLLTDVRGGDADVPPQRLAEAFRKVGGADPILLLDDEQMEGVLSRLVSQPDATPFLAAYEQWQTDRIVARDPEAAGGIAEMFRGGKTSRAESTEKPPSHELTARRLQDYMRGRWPERSGLEIESLALLPGGFSKQTIMVTAREDGRTEKFVLRKDFEISPAERVVRDEYPLLRAIASVGTIPVPVPQWLESDPAPLGTPAMAVDLVRGTSDFSAILADPAKARRFADELAATLARLHALDAHALLDLGPGQSTRDHVAAEIDRWHSDWRRWRTEPHPLLEASFAWLRNNIPATAVPPAIVHGDVGIHNMLVDDGRLASLLDWEFAHIGDPAEDVVYCRFFMEHFVEWERFLQVYEDHGGTRPSREAEAFYAVWASARNAAGCSGARHYFLEKSRADARLGISGLTFLPRFELDAFSCVVKASQSS